MKLIGVLVLFGAVMFAGNPAGAQQIVRTQQVRLDHWHQIGSNSTHPVDLGCYS